MNSQQHLQLDGMGSPFPTPQSASGTNSGRMRPQGAQSAGTGGCAFFDFDALLDTSFTGRNQSATLDTMRPQHQTGVNTDQNGYQGFPDLGNLEDPFLNTVGGMSDFDMLAAKINETTNQSNQSGFMDPITPPQTLGAAEKFTVNDFGVHNKTALPKTPSSRKKTSKTFRQTRPACSTSPHRTLQKLSPMSDAALAIAQQVGPIEAKWSPNRRDTVQNGWQVKMQHGVQNNMHNGVQNKVYNSFQNTMQGSFKNNMQYNNQKSMHFNGQNSMQFNNQNNMQFDDQNTQFVYQNNMQHDNQNNLQHSNQSSMHQDNQNFVQSGSPNFIQYGGQIYAPISNGSSSPPQFLSSGVATTTPPSSPPTQKPKSTKRTPTKRVPAANKHVVKAAKAIKSPKLTKPVKVTKTTTKRKSATPPKGTAARERTIQELYDAQFMTLTHEEKARLLLPVLQGIDPLTGKFVGRPGSLASLITSQQPDDTGFIQQSIEKDHLGAQFTPIDDTATEVEEAQEGTQFAPVDDATTEFDDAQGTPQFSPVEDTTSKFEEAQFELADDATTEFEQNQSPTQFTPAGDTNTEIEGAQDATQSAPHYEFSATQFAPVYGLPATQYEEAQEAAHSAQVECSTIANLGDISSQSIPDCDDHSTEYINIQTTGDFNDQLHGHINGLLNPEMYHHSSHTFDHFNNESINNFDDLFSDQTNTQSNFNFMSYEFQSEFPSMFPAYVIDNDFDPRPNKEPTFTGILYEIDDTSEPADADNSFDEDKNGNKDTITDLSMVEQAAAELTQDYGTKRQNEALQRAKELKEAGRRR